MKSIPEELSKEFNVTLIARNSKIERTRQINLEKVETSSNIFTFLFNILKTFKKNDTSYLIMIVPAILMMKSGLFCKYYSIVFFVVYFFLYKMAYRKIDLK